MPSLQRQYQFSQRGFETFSSIPSLPPVTRKGLKATLYLFHHIRNSKIDPRDPLFQKVQGEAYPPFGRQGTGLFERTHLSDQRSSALWRGPIRGLHYKSLMVSTNFFYSSPQRGPLAL
jgi:hypothetical protein